MNSFWINTFAASFFLLDVLVHYQRKNSNNKNKTYSSFGISFFFLVVASFLHHHASFTIIMRNMNWWRTRKNFNWNIFFVFNLGTIRYYYQVFNVNFSIFIQCVCSLISFIVLSLLNKAIQMFLILYFVFLLFLHIPYHNHIIYYNNYIACKLNFCIQNKIWIWFLIQINNDKWNENETEKYIKRENKNIVSGFITYLMWLLV